MSDHSKIEWTDASWRRMCSCCNRLFQREAFFRDASRPDGMSYVCRECKNAKARANYQPRPVRKRGWLAPTRNGDKLQARRRINYLVEQGTIPHPDDLPCFDCADEIYIGHYRHEYDHALGYDGENQLYVEPVCSKCHHNREDARHG